MKIQFMWNGIKIDGKLYRCHYSNGFLVNQIEETITIYARDYDRIPDVFGCKIENDSDPMTDYFEKDRIRIPASNPFYSDVKKALELQDQHWIKMSERRKARYEMRNKNSYRFPALGNLQISKSGIGSL